MIEFIIKVKRIIMKETFIGIIIFAMFCLIEKFIFNGGLQDVIALMVVLCYIQLLKLSR